MSNIKKFNEFVNEGVENIRDLAGLSHIESWIESVWDKLGDLDDNEIETIFSKIEKAVGLESAEIIDARLSADKLHYYQTGSTINTGGLDTGDFIEDFENIQSQVDSIISDSI